jgi:hypothetical protein
VSAAILEHLLDRHQPRLVMGFDNLARAALIAAIPTLFARGPAGGCASERAKAALPMRPPPPRPPELHLCAADIKPPDQSVFDPKDVSHHLIGKEIPFEIAHHLMHFYDHFRLGTLGKRNRLDVRIDHCPLLRPVTAYSFAPVDMPPFHAICPNYIFVQGCEHRLHVASVEAIVDSPK